MILLNRLTDTTNELEMLQKAKQLDDEVRMISTAGYQTDFAERAKERFVLKPFMIQALFQMTERNYRTVCR